MKIKLDKIIDDFYEKYKDTELKGYSHTAISNCAKSPFRRLKEIIKDGLFIEIRINYFGVFRVREYQVRRRLEIYRAKMEESVDNEKKYPYFKMVVEKMESYIKNLEESRK